MTAISLSLAAGQTVDQIAVGTNAPSVSGGIELRIDTTAVITDKSFAGGVRCINAGEINAFMNLFEAYMSGAGRKLLPI